MLVAPGPRVDMQMPGLPVMSPQVDANIAPATSCFISRNRIWRWRAASINSTDSPPGCPTIKGVPASLNAVASTSTVVDIRHPPGICCGGKLSTVRRPSTSPRLRREVGMSAFFALIPGKGACPQVQAGGPPQPPLSRKRREGNEMARQNAIAPDPPPRGIPLLRISQYSGRARRTARSLFKKQGECSMSEQTIGRRTFLARAAAATLSAAGALHIGDGFAQEAVAVPNSAGTDAPKLKVPSGACDCHHHIYDTRFPFSRPGARMVADSRVQDYRLLQRRLGITRNIVVTPTPFPASVADNLVTLDALKAFGANARGVAIVYPEITDAELKTLADGGVRGIRFSLAAAGASPPIPTSTADTIEALSKRVAAVGWHVQFNIDAAQIVALEALLNRLQSQIVFDHMGHMPQPAGVDHPLTR